MSNNKRGSIVHNVLFILMFSLIFIAAHPPIRDKKELRGLQLITNYPVRYYKEKGETKVYNLKDTINIFYYKAYILYQLPPTLQLKNDQQIKGTESYFIYRAGDKDGLFIRLLNTFGSGAKMEVDTFLLQRG